MENQKDIKYFFIIIFMTTICFSKLEIKPAYQSQFYSSGSDIIIENRPLYILGLGIKFQYRKNNFFLNGNFTNNRFHGTRSKPNLFNSKKGIGWIGTHELTGKKFDYDISSLELSYSIDDYTFMISTLNPVVDISYSSLLISNKIPTIPHFSFYWNIDANKRYSYFHGRLKSEVLDSSNIDILGNKNTELERYFVFHQLIYEPVEFIEFRFGEFVVYGNRGLEFSYLPFIPFWSIQHSLGDLDNIQWNLKSIIKPSNNLKIYNVILIDELRPGVMFEKNNRNWVAWQLGVLFDDIFFKDLIQFEYSWLDHRVYRHRFPINDYYSFGYPLGFWAGPHSKEILLFYQVNFKESDLKIKYSNCLRGELTNEMIINQYNNVYYERFSQFIEKKNTFELIYSKTIFNSLKIKLGVEYIDWKDEINHSKKKSFNISISNILD